MTATNNFRPAALIIVILAATQFCIQVSLLGRGEAYIASSLTIDDTYYYLQTAWNAQRMGFVTFDGLHKTNGVQLLWFLIILPLAGLVSSKAALLSATMVVTFLLNALCYLPILKIGALLRQPALSLALASLWTLQSLPFRIYSMGMENSLHALVFWCVVWQGTAFLAAVQSKTQPRLWGLSIVLILNAWTRLDSALLSAIVYGYCLMQLARMHGFSFKRLMDNQAKPVSGATFAASLACVVQLTAFRLMGDAFLPVSALVKTSGAARGLSSAAADKFIEVFVVGMPSILQGRFPPMVLACLGIAATILVMAGQRHLRQSAAPLLSLWFCLALGELVYSTGIALSGVEYTPYFIWYRSPSFIYWIITAALLGLLLVTWLGPAGRRFGLQAWAPVTTSLLVVGAAVYLFSRSINFVSPLYVARYEAALWLARHSPPDTIFAAWNTGQLGYFSNRSFVNLDGLINDVDYYRQVLRGQRPLADYLAANDVDYIVDYAAYHPLPDYPIVQAFPIHDGTGRAIHVWQVSPHLLSLP